MDDIKTLYFRELREELEGWEFKDITSTERLYYKVGEKKSSFQFTHVEIYSWLVGEEEGLGDGVWRENSQCDILINGESYFDGVRHLWFGDERSDNFGYFYYPNIKSLTLVLIQIQALEKQYTTSD